MEIWTAGIRTSPATATSSHDADVKYFPLRANNWQVSPYAVRRTSIEIFGGVGIDAKPATEFLVWKSFQRVPTTDNQVIDSARIVSSDHVHLPARHALIERASSREEILAAIRLFGMGKAADRTRDLLEMIADEQDQPDMELESIRNMAKFLMNKGNLMDPVITVTPNALMLCEWRFTEGGTLALEFLPSDMIRFAGVFGASTEPQDRKRLNGTVPRDNVLQVLSSLLPLR